MTVLDNPMALCRCCGYVKAAEGRTMCEVCLDTDCDPLHGCDADSDALDEAVHEEAARVTP